jgi:hypothetical protein
VSDEPTKIPAHIDEPPYLLFWRIDEVLPIGVGLVAGILLAQLTICLGLGLVWRASIVATVTTDPMAICCMQSTGTWGHWLQAQPQHA